MKVYQITIINTEYHDVSTIEGIDKKIVDHDAWVLYNAIFKDEGIDVCSKQMPSDEFLRRLDNGKTIHVDYDDGYNAYLFRVNDFELWEV